MLRPRPNIEKVPASYHGGPNFEELKKLGISPQDVLDFSVSTNPFGPPPGLMLAMKEASIDLYPDSTSSELRSHLANKLQVSPDNLIVGSGSTELIRLVSTAYFGSGDAVLIPEPTYGEYEIACNLMDAAVMKQHLTEETRFKLNIPEAAELIRQRRPEGIFLCNPNNPTGQYLTCEDINCILSAARDSLVVLDEAYIAFTDASWSSLGLIDGKNLVILRSMTKDYALAGLRLGYAVANQAIISVLERVKPPWNVSSVAQRAGIYALKNEGYLETCHTRIKEARDSLIRGLRELGLQPLPSQANFFLVKVGDAAGLRRALLKKAILVRDCTSFGLPEYIRLAPRSIEDCKKLISALKQIKVDQYGS